MVLAVACGKTSQPAASEARFTGTITALDCSPGAACVMEVDHVKTVHFGADPRRPAGIEVGDDQDVRARGAVGAAVEVFAATAGDDDAFTLDGKRGYYILVKK